MSEIDIENLIAKTALSNRSAFDSLYQASSPKLFAVVMRILKNRELAEDALQEVFVKIWQKADSYRAGQQAPMSWLVTIARNHSIDVIRANKRKFEDIEGLAAAINKSIRQEGATIVSILLTTMIRIRLLKKLSTGMSTLL